MTDATVTITKAELVKRFKASGYDELAALTTWRVMQPKPPGRWVSEEAEMHGLRVECFELSNKLATAKAKCERLRKALERNLHRCERSATVPSGHHCDYRVQVEAIEQASRAALAARPPGCGMRPGRGNHD